jgi:hypothetical protein
MKKGTLVLQPNIDDREYVIRWAVRMAGGEYQSRLMQTAVREIAYDFEDNLGGAWLAHPSYATDMDGCIAWFEGLFPEVQQIQVFAGDEIDIIYDRRGDEWVACVPKREDGQ